MKKTSLILLCVALGCSGDDDNGGIDAGGGYRPGDPVTISVAGVFTAGTALRDGYGGGVATVGSDGEVTVTPDSSGVVLLEKDGAAASPFSWSNVTMYQVIVDRFMNGDTGNDLRYGRKKDGQMEVGTFHGGDWKGLASKLDYLADLGVTALWISPIVEQVHGWVPGGSGDFKHYAYHGYYALDFTKLDANFGTLADLQGLVDAAHQRGIRVLVDVVINHPGYATGADLRAYLPEVFTDGTGAAFATYDATATGSFNNWNQLVNYSSQAWKDWWSPKWIRAGFPGFSPGGSTDATRQLAFLPDFKTESTEIADTPVLLTRKTDSAFVPQTGFTVRDYLTKWHSDWVRQVGFDGFRVDTVKNVEPDACKALKDAGVAALAAWKAENPSKKLDDAPFWTVAEYFPHYVMKDDLYATGGFDSVINFDFQGKLSQAMTMPDLPSASALVDQVFTQYSTAVQDPTFGILSYASSHDTQLAFAVLGYDPARQRAAGTLLLLAPGGVNIYYGDESGRRLGPGLSDSVQATRSDMNFSTTDTTILTHWQKLGAFRKKHAAIGGGTHARIESPEGTYAFSRKLGDDAVVVIITAPR